MTDKTPQSGDKSSTKSKGGTNPLTRGFAFSEKTPEGDDKERLVCDDCGWVHYVNPKIVVGSVIRWENKILMARRAIEPRKGFWTLPAGFMEERETTEEGAKREAFEEAEAKIDIKALLAVYDVPHISQVQLMFLADLISPDVAPGIESLEVAFFTWDEIPWKELAFPSVTWALKQYEDLVGSDEIRGLQINQPDAFAPFRNPDPKDERYRFHF